MGGTKPGGAEDEPSAATRRPRVIVPTRQHDVLLQALLYEFIYALNAFNTHGATLPWNRGPPARGRGPPLATAPEPRPGMLPVTATGAPGAGLNV